MEAILLRHLLVRINGHVDKDRRGFAALRLPVVVVAVAKQVLIGSVSRQPVVGNIPRAAELGLALLLIRPHLQIVKTN